MCWWNGGREAGNWKWQIQDKVGSLKMDNSYSDVSSAHNEESAFAGQFCQKNAQPGCLCPNSWQWNLILGWMSHCTRLVIILSLGKKPVCFLIISRLVRKLSEYLQHITHTVFIICEDSMQYVVWIYSGTIYF